MGTNNGDGSHPYTPLIIDSHGRLYGGTLQGGNSHDGGIIFRLFKKNGQWKEGILYTFCSQTDCKDGAGPTASLSYAGMNNGAPYDGISPLFGVTDGGGINNSGTAFQLVRNGRAWTQSVLHYFCSQAHCADGKYPETSLLPDSFGTCLVPLSRVA